MVSSWFIDRITGPLEIQGIENREKSRGPDKVELKRPVKTFWTQFFDLRSV